MCLAVPACITSVDEVEQTATVAIGNIKRGISTALLDEVAVGDYVLVHVGYALSRLSEEEAKLTLAMFEELGKTDAEVSAT